MVAIRGEVVVQFWLRPGDEVVELSFSGGESVSTPDVLEGMFLNSNDIFILWGELSVTIKKYIYYEITYNPNNT